MRHSEIKAIVSFFPSLLLPSLTSFTYFFRPPVNALICICSVERYKRCFG
jgi:hypothetical protein